MASSITLSAGVRQNLLALQNTASLLSTTQNRLATGKKVNSALDNPTNFFTSSSLSARASDLSSLLDSMTNGINTLKQADNGLTAITKAVESMQATVSQARQDASWKSASYTVDATAIGTATAKKLTISGGAVGTTGVDIDLNTTGAAAHQAVVTSSLANYVPPSAATAATNAVLTGTATIGGGTGDIDASGGNITFQIDSVTVTLSSTGGSSSNGHYNLTDLKTAINGTVGITVNATDDGSGHLVLTSTAAAGASDSINVGGFSSGTASSVLGLSSASANGSAATAAQTYSFTINGTAITLDSTGSGNQAGNTGANAAASINAQLTAAGVTNITASFASNKITLTGAADGSNSITVAGSNAATVFGTALTDTGTTAAAAAVKTVDQLVDAINTTSALQGKVKASNDGGKLNIQNLSTEDLSVVGATSTTVNGGTGTSNTQTIAGNTVRKALISQFNDLRDQLDKLADDASFNGINLLHGDTLKLVFNETNTSSISIVSNDADGINVDVLGIGQADATEFSTNSSLDTRADALHDALTQLRSQSSAFGSNLSIVQNRQDFTKAMINTLQTGSDALVLADSNEEAANLLALQTRQQLSTTALSLASQADQAVLRLF